MAGRKGESALTLNPIQTTAQKQAQSLAFISAQVSWWKMGRSTGVGTGNRKPTLPMSGILQHQGTDTVECSMVGEDPAQLNIRGSVSSFT